MKIVITKDTYMPEQNPQEYYPSRARNYWSKMLTSGNFGLISKISLMKHMLFLKITHISA